MDEPVDPPPLPPERVASPSAAMAGCIVVCGLAALLFLYIGSFAFIVADLLNSWGFVAYLDERTIEFLTVFYGPLIWLVVATGLFPVP